MNSTLKTSALIILVSLTLPACEQGIKFSTISTPGSGLSVSDPNNDYTPPVSQTPPVTIHPPPTPTPAPQPAPVDQPPAPAPQPAPVPQPWTPGTKAEKLAQIQFLSCPISNKSDAFYGYSAANAPVRDDVFNRIVRCTDQAYPETPLSPEANDTITKLLSSDDSMRHKFYDFLWYQPPYTDHFELYFGLDTVEARRILCNHEDPRTVLAAPLYTTEYWQAEAADHYWQWLFDPAAQARWKTVQSYRDQLRRCLD